MGVYIGLDCQSGGVAVFLPTRVVFHIIVLWIGTSLHMMQINFSACVIGLMVTAISRKRLIVIPVLISLVVLSRVRHLESALIFCVIELVAIATSNYLQVTLRLTLHRTGNKIWQICVSVTCCRSVAYFIADLADRSRCAISC